MPIWFDPQPLKASGDAPPDLSQAGRSRAYPFALLADDVYGAVTNLLGQCGADWEIRWRGSWTDVIAVAHERREPGTLDKIRVAFSKLNGFNASIYQITTAYDRAFVVAYEGTKPPNLSKIHLLHAMAHPTSGFARLAADNVETIKDCLFGNSAVLDVVNKLERAFPFGLFSQFLNPDRAPSSQYEMALRVARCVDALGMGEVILTGHSLGGGLAQFAASKTGLKAVVFNSAGTGLPELTKAAAETARANICHIYTGFRANGVGGTADSAFNYAVAKGTNLLSRQLGNSYMIGRGGHGMKELLHLLQQRPAVS